MALTAEHKAAMQQFTASHNGNKLDQQKMLKPNPMVAKILVARLAAMSPQQQDALKGILTPETQDALKALLPEFAAVMNKRLATAQPPAGGAGDAGAEG